MTPFSFTAVLTAAIALGSLLVNARSNATALESRAVDAPYIFTAFTQNSESNLYVYTSDNAGTFNLLAGPTYTPASGLIRDPSVHLHTE